MDKSGISMSCENCMFETDRDCKLDKLKILQANGAVLTEQNNFTVIHGRLCNYKRNNFWWTKYKDTYLEQLETEIKIRYGVIINANNVHSLSNAISYLESQYISPETYYIIYNNENLERQSQNIQNAINITNKRWHLKYPLEKSNNEFDFANEYIVSGTVKEPFVLYIKDTNLPKQDLIYQLNKSINIDLKQVMLYTDFDYIFAATSLINMFKFDYLSTAIIEAGHADKICRL